MLTTPVWSPSLSHLVPRIIQRYIKNVLFSSSQNSYFSYSYIIIFSPRKFSLRGAYKSLSRWCIEGIRWTRKNRDSPMNMHGFMVIATRSCARNFRKYIKNTRRILQKYYYRKSQTAFRTNFRLIWKAKWK